MGINQSSVLQQKKFLNEWIITEHLNQNRAIWHSRLNPTTELEEYPIYAQSEDDINLIKRLYEIRKNSPELVQAYHLRQIQKTGLCTGGAEGKLYLERIYLRLSDLQHVPYPDSLHLMFNCLAGYRKLFRQIGPFKVQEDQVGFTREGEAKVWLDSDFSSFQAKMMEQSEQSMVRSIVQLIEDHIDQETLPKEVSSLRSCIYSQKKQGQDRDKQKVGFDQTLIRVREFANRNNNGEIPKFMECIKQVGVGNILKSLQGGNINNKFNQEDSSKVWSSNVGQYNSAYGGAQQNSLNVNMLQNNLSSNTFHKAQSLNQLHFRSSSPQITKPLPTVIPQPLSPRKAPLMTVSTPIHLPSPHPRASFRYSSPNHGQSVQNSVNPTNNHNLPLQKTVSFGQLNGLKPRLSHHDNVEQIRNHVLEERLVNNKLPKILPQQVVVQPVVKQMPRQGIPLQVAVGQQRPSQLIRQSVRTNVQGMVPVRQSVHVNPPIINHPGPHIYPPPINVQPYQPYQNVPQNIAQNTFVPILPVSLNAVNVVHQTPMVATRQVQFHAQKNAQNTSIPVVQTQQMISNSNNPEQPQIVETIQNSTDQQQVLTPNRQPIDLLEELIDEVEEGGIRVQEVSQEKIQNVQPEEQAFNEERLLSQLQELPKSQQFCDPQHQYEQQLNEVLVQEQIQRQPEPEPEIQLQPKPEQKTLFSEQLIHNHEQFHSSHHQQDNVVMRAGENIEDYADVFNSEEEEKGEEEVGEINENECYEEEREQVNDQEWDNEQEENQYYQQEQQNQQEVQEYHHHLEGHRQEEVEQNHYYHQQEVQQKTEQFHNHFEQPQHLYLPEPHQQQQSAQQQQPQPSPTNLPKRQSRMMVQSNTVNIQISRVSQASNQQKDTPFVAYERITPLNSPIVGFYKKDSELYQVESQLQEEDGCEGQREDQVEEEESHYQQPVSYSIDSQSYKQKLYDRESNQGSGIKQHQFIDSSSPNKKYVEDTKLIDQIKSKPTVDYSFDQYFDKTFNKANFINIDNNASTFMDNFKTYHENLSSSLPSSYMTSNNSAYDYAYNEPVVASLAAGSKYTSNARTDVNLQDGKSSSTLLEQIRKITSGQFRSSNYDYSKPKVNNTKQTFSNSDDYDISSTFNAYSSSSSYSRNLRQEENSNSYNYGSYDNYNYGQNAAFLGIQNGSYDGSAISHTEPESYNRSRIPSEEYHIDYDPEILADIQKMAN